MGSSTPARVDRPSSPAVCRSSRKAPTAPAETAVVWRRRGRRAPHRRPAGPARPRSRWRQRPCPDLSTSHVEWARAYADRRPLRQVTGGRVNSSRDAAQGLPGRRGDRADGRAGRARRRGHPRTVLAPHGRLLQPCTRRDEGRQLHRHGDRPRRDHLSRLEVRQPCRWTASRTSALAGTRSGPPIRWSSERWGRPSSGTASRLATTWMRSGRPCTSPPGSRRTAPSAHGSLLRSRGNPGAAPWIEEGPDT